MMPYAHWTNVLGGVLQGKTIWDTRIQLSWGGIFYVTKFEIYDETQGAHVVLENISFQTLTVFLMPTLITIKVPILRKM